MYQGNTRRALLLALAAIVFAAVPAVAQSPVDQTAPSRAEYVIGAQDVLTITVWDSPDLSGKFTVETDGSFTFPLIGRIQAGGLTLRQVEAELKKRLADGYFPGEGETDQLASLIARVRQAAGDLGRDPDEIEINAMFTKYMTDPEAGVEQFAELGVGRIMVPAFFFAGPGGLDRMDEFAGRAIGAAGN